MDGGEKYGSTNHYEEVGEVCYRSEPDSEIRMEKAGVALHNVSCAGG